MQNNTTFGRTGSGSYQDSFNYLEGIGEFGLHLGVTDSIIDEIVEYSNNADDTSLLSNTSDKKRLSSREKVHAWLAESTRYTFSLVTIDGHIVGIWWARPSSPPNMQTIIDRSLYNAMMEHTENICTGGIRIYPPFRGQGLARPLLQRSTEYFRKLFSEAYMCIDIDEQNIASQKTYERAGYMLIGYGENQKTVESQSHARRVYLEIPS